VNRSASDALEFFISEQKSWKEGKKQEYEAAKIGHPISLMLNELQLKRQGWYFPFV
jgi:hypothetical protein